MSVRRGLSVRSVLSAVTLLLIAFVIYEARHSLERAWALMGQVNPWILLLVVPTVVISYFATGGMIFSYLKQKKLIDHLGVVKMMRISMELNFVNHVLPSGGASGVAYFNWRLSKLGVASARSTMAQAVRYVAGFIASTLMLIIGLLVVTVDGTVNRWTILMSAALVISMIVGTFVLYFAVSNKRRIAKIASWITRTGNAIVRRLTLGKVSAALNFNRVDKFFNELHEDYVELSRNKRLLFQPVWWGMLYVVMDVAMFWVTFWSFGVYVNPATILIAYNIAAVAGFLVATPGGVGPYEALMVMVIVMSGVDNANALAGIILARTLILLVTIVGGYIFYQQSILKYGRPKNLAASS